MFLQSSIMKSELAWSRPGLKKKKNVQHVHVKNLKWTSKILKTVCAGESQFGFLVISHVLCRLMSILYMFVTELVCVCHQLCIAWYTKNFVTDSYDVIFVNFVCHRLCLPSTLSLCHWLCHYVTDFVADSVANFVPDLYEHPPYLCCKEYSRLFFLFLQVPLRGLRSGVQRGAARQLIHPLLLLDIQILGRQWKQLYLPPDTCLRLILIPRKWRNFKGKKENLNEFWTHVVIHITCQ